MKIEVTRAFSLNGTVHQVGEMLEVPVGIGAELIGLRKAVGAISPDSSVETKPVKKSRKDAPIEAATE